MKIDGADRFLIEAMQKGSEEAFTHLYRKYSPSIYVNILRIVRDPLQAEEMTQEMFTKVWEKRACRGMREDFAGYIFRMSQNMINDFFRRLKRDRKMMERFRFLVEENYEHVEELLNLKQSASLVEAAIRELSPQQQKVYELVKVEGCTYKKAAEVLGISPLTVKEYLVLSKKSVQNHLLSNLDAKLLLLFFLSAL